MWHFAHRSVHIFTEVNLAQVRFTPKSLYLTEYIFNAFPLDLHAPLQQLYFIYKLVFSVGLCYG